MRWPLTGREAELRLIGEALSGGAAGVVITGPAGVGKTRLTAEAASLAEAAGSAVSWVRATRSARSIPLGAFAALLPAGEPVAGVELLARARGALVERAAGRRLVLCVDDGQLLDDASAALVHQLAAAGEAFAVVSVRRDEPGPDALRALWKDELCVLLELSELGRVEVSALLEAALGGPVDGRTANRLWELSRGNALFVRELVRHGTDRGLLSDDGGVWRWRGEVRAGMRLADVVDLRIERLDARARRVLELVAVGSPLEVGLLSGDESASLETLERAELVVRRREERRRFADVAHPLHGEAMRAQLTEGRVEAIRTRLADAVEARGGRRGGDLLRVAVWRLEAGEAGHASLFARAAERALGAADAGLAGRLAEAAVRAGGGFGARLTYARSLAALGRGAEADELFIRLASEAEDDLATVTVAVASARNLFWALDRAGEADAVLAEASARVGDKVLRDQLAAHRARFTSARGRPSEALAAAEPLLADESVDEAARCTVALGAIEALFSIGRTEEAVALVEAYLPAARRLRDGMPHLEVVLLGMRAMALRVAGRFVEATEFSESAYAGLLARRSAAGTAVESFSLGLIWLARGRVRTAARFCRESASLLRDGDGVGMLPVAVAGIAQAAGQAGDADAARHAVVEMEATQLGHKGFEVELGLGRAWAAAASGELSSAREYARSASDLARSRGQDAYAVRALHDLSRLGGFKEAAPELASLADRVDGPLAGVAAAYAAARVAGDGTALVAAAERFAGLDALLSAAEAADAASAAFREEGRDASARAAAARAGAWLASCEGARPPTLVGDAEAADLTSREREIAMLAAGGATSRDIADRLVISVRTVDNHLANAYRKLGVTRRQDLAGVLHGTPT